MTPWGWPEPMACVTINILVQLVCHQNLVFFLGILSFCLVEFGVVGALNTYYPTTGFSAAYTLAHEIGKTKHFQSRK